MKKIIYFLLFMFFFTNISFAATKIKEKDVEAFREDAQKVLEIVLDSPNRIENKSNRQFVKDIQKESYNCYQKSVKNKNDIKYSKDCIKKLQKNADYFQYVDIYTELDELIKKYKLFVAANENYYEYVYREYLHKYEVPLSNDFIDFVNDISDESLILYDMADKLQAQIQETEKANKIQAQQKEKQQPVVKQKQTSPKQIEKQTQKDNQQNKDSKNDWWFGKLVLLALALYFLPTIIVIARNKKNGCSIIIINLFLGWTFLGWVITLAWACMDDK